MSRTKNDKNYFLSVIVPIYNKEKFLRKTISSILKQKKIFELFLINDCSTDKSLKISKEYEKRFNFIKVINSKKKLYVSEARNLGIRAATGKYIVFIDADDQVKDNYFKNIYETLMIKKTDLLINPLNDFKFLKSSITKNDILKSMDKFSFVGYCWRIIYERKFIIKNNLYFDKDIFVCEDEEFTAKCIKKSRTINILKRNFYTKNFVTKSLSTVNLGQNSYGLKLVNFLISYTRVYLSLKKNYHSKNSQLLKSFLNNRIQLILNKIYPLIILSDISTLKKVSSIIKLTNPKYLKNNFFLLLKNKLTKNISNKLNKLTPKFIYIFCCDHPSFAVIDIAKNIKLKISGIFDNNFQNFQSDFRIFQIPLLKMNKRIIKKINKNNSAILIVNQKIKNIHQIERQLIKLGILKRNLFSLLFNFKF